MRTEALEVPKHHPLLDEFSFISDFRFESVFGHLPLTPTLRGCRGYAATAVEVLPVLDYGFY